MWNGIINVYKEPGYTSHDVVARLRGMLKQKKIGHTGTLDPAAEGVLPVCLGIGTKLCDMLTEKDKCYETVLLLGVTTDTQDMTGTVLEEKTVNVSEQQIWEATAHFTGNYDQIPPMYSAIKIDGKRLYQLARKGIEIERQPREVTIYELKILKIDLPRIYLRVGCSKGTYIRALCEDIGKYLGCGGTMECLVRIQSGQFLIKDSKTLDEIEECVKNNTIQEQIISVEAALSMYPSVVSFPDADKLLANGNPVKISMIQESAAVLEKEWMKEKGSDSLLTVRMHNSTNGFIGLYQLKKEQGMYKPYKMFLEQ